jgi:hypothetical protein
MRIPLTLLLAALAAAAEIELIDGRRIPYDSLVIMMESPRQAVTAKAKDGMQAFRYSQVRIASLPKADQDAIAAFIRGKKAKRIVLRDDDWVNRNETLLRGDPRFAYARKLVRVGASSFTVKNTLDELVTIGVRIGDRGYELSIEPKKSKGMQVPDGTLFFYMAFESADGASLVVQKSEEISLTRTAYTLTVVKGTDDEAVAGIIPIPEDERLP